jgi:D-alanyl-lipoteichoic acid acyltransferase DltB (MBOAT superfamily)
MLFNSLTFLAFFAVVFLLHRLMPTWGTRKGLLLLGSYIFYAAWNPPYIAILLFSTALDWWLAKRIWLSTNERKRRILLIVSLVANLSLLGFFKYGGFLLQNFVEMAGALGVIYAPPAWNIVLPVGISFYTFASLSYTLDVYRREIDADVGFLDYALFVSFFPHLVAGPIVRARAFLPQLREPRNASSAQIGWGLAMVFMGLFSKTVLADSLFAPIADAVYLAPGQYSSLDTWAAVIGFSGQIYYDFSGYSLCAIGLALCFGFAFPDNFHHPYAARGFSDFWRRWHISLSTWLRDYLYIPLGGGRNGKWRTYRNIALTMLIGGLWHGASWMFVLWGALHGLFLIVERWLKPRAVQDAGEPGRRIGMTLLTCLLVTLAWIPFRASSPSAAGAIWAGLFRSNATAHLDPWPVLLCFIGMLMTIGWHFTLRDTSIEAYLGRQSEFSKAAALSICLIGIFLVSGGDERAFIYFQF